MQEYSMTKKLTIERRDELKLLHRSEHGRRFADRIKAVLLLDDGYSYSKVAEIVLLDDQTIRNYQTIFTQQGISGLLKTDYNGGLSALSAQQQSDLKDHIANNTYSSSTAIVEYVKQAYCIEYSNSGMVHLLERLGFVYKKTKLVPGKADAKKQQKFLQEYHQLKEQINSNDELLFMDGAHPQHNPVSSYAWIMKGQEKEIPTNTGRKRININGAINIKNYDTIAREDERINAQSTIELLKQIEDAYPAASNIYIIIDDARYYRAQIVCQFLKKSRIQFKFLPPYSPNLNLIERLWKFLKKKVINNCYYESYDVFKKTVMAFFENITDYHDELVTLLNEKFQIIGTQFSKT